SGRQRQDQERTNSMKSHRISLPHRLTFFAFMRPECTLSLPRPRYRARSIKPDSLLPGKLYREQRTASRATFTLAIPITFVGVFQTAALSVFLQATGQPPGTIRTAVRPAGV